MSRIQSLLADDPPWLVALKVVALFALGLLMTIFMIVWERKVVGRMQRRPGPNRVGPGGWLQSVADALKLALKEDVRPARADRVVYVLAPVISVVPAFVAFSVIPFGGEVSILGEPTALQLVDLPVGVLVVLACSSVGVYGIVLGGWASGSPYSLFGALRSAAQVISYEIALGLSIVAVVLRSGSLSTADIVAAQDTGWYVWLLPPSFVLFAVAMVGETNRAPFDLPEAESELVGGFHTEYTSLRFALFFLAEYVSMVTVSAMATTLFLGGGHLPWLGHVWAGFDDGWFQLLAFVGKTLAFLFLFIWLRGTLPRMRYDQFMRLGWTVLVPVGLVWIVVVFGARMLAGAGADRVLPLLVCLPVLVAITVAAVRTRRGAAVEPAAIEPAADYPVPPLDLTVPAAPPHRTRERREHVS